MGINILLGIISAVTTLACALMAALLHRKTERIKIMENQLSDKKYKAYADLVGMFYDVLKDVKEFKTTNPKRMRDRMIRHLTNGCVLQQKMIPNNIYK